MVKSFSFGKMGKEKSTTIRDGDDDDYENDEKKRNPSKYGRLTIRWTFKWKRVHNVLQCFQSSESGRERMCCRKKCCVVCSAATVLNHCVGFYIDSHHIVCIKKASFRFNACMCAVSSWILRLTLVVNRIKCVICCSMYDDTFLLKL